ncbi:MAG: hypothetical protein FWH36_03050 [Lentimicrobiaceae bacterium]|nr:hypothetical protein [Lentimicrobiaceae bacterium]
MTRNCILKSQKIILNKANINLRPCRVHLQTGMKCESRVKVRTLNRTRQKPAIYLQSAGWEALDYCRRRLSQKEQKKTGVAIRLILGSSV